MQRVLLTILCAALLAACSRDPGGGPAAPAGTPGETARAPLPELGDWWKAQPRGEWAAYERISSPEPWFEVYRIRDNIHAIYEPRQHQEVISYLVTGNKMALLFDSGLGIGDIRKVTRSLTPKPVVVLNSHSHPAHVGGNHLYDLVWGLEHRFSARRSRGQSNEAMWPYIGPGRIHGDAPHTFKLEKFRSKNWHYARWLKKGDSIELGGTTLELIHTPGHSPDSVSLLDRENRLLFTGDTFYLGALQANTKEASLEAWGRSAARLAALAGQVDTLLMSHYVPSAPASYLQELDAAFKAIASGTANFESSNGAREYHFEGFSILAGEAP